MFCYYIQLQDKQLYTYSLLIGPGFAGDKFLGRKLPDELLSLWKALLTPVLSFPAPETPFRLPRNCVYQPPFLSEEVPAAPPGQQPGAGAGCQPRPIQWSGPESSHAVQPVHVQEWWKQVDVLSPAGWAAKTLPTHPPRLHHRPCNEPGLCGTVFWRLKMDLLCFFLCFYFKDVRGFFEEEKSKLQLE